MSEYWKSQPRHYCEFCLCWIADNKPSRDFHEKGKKHQVNVEKKIAEVRKKGIKKAEKEEEENSTLKQIEKAALKALQEDLKRDPSLASLYGVQIKESALPELNATSAPAGPTVAQQSSVPRQRKRSRFDKVECPDPVEQTKEIEETPVEQPEPAITQLWQELKSPEGYPYYWHTVTNEVTWVKPEDYDEEAQEIPESSSAKDQQEQSSASSSETEDQVTSSPEPQQIEAAESPADSAPLPGDIASIPLPEDIPNIPLPGSTSDISEVQETEEENEEAEEADEETSPAEQPEMRPERPVRKRGAYGSWETVERKEEEQVDLQLPEVKELPVAKVITISEPKIKFREKKVDTLGAELVAFKKRKLNSSFKLRKREDDS